MSDKNVEKAVRALSKALEVRAQAKHSIVWEGNRFIIPEYIDNLPDAIKAPELCKQTLAVVEACDDLGIEIERTRSGSPINADSYRMSAPFLDGGLSSMTGNYWFYERAAWVSGSRAVLLIALHLGLKVRKAWLQKYGLTDASLASLKSEISSK